MTKKKSFYQPEFKTQAISLVREAKRSASEVAKELGINVNTLYNWLSPITNKLTKNPSNYDIMSENKRVGSRIQRNPVSGWL